MSVFGWNRVEQGSTEHGEEDLPLGPYALSGPVPRPDPRRTPMRGDIAHIGLAGRYFVPHYVVPMPRMVGDMGAALRAAPNHESEIVYDLSPGQRFDLLDSSGGWAFGCLSLEGPVGYVPLSDLLDPFA
jgi:hypothetical protein